MKRQVLTIKRRGIGRRVTYRVAAILGAFHWPDFVCVPESGWCWYGGERWCLDICEARMSFAFISMIREYTDFVSEYRIRNFGVLPSEWFETSPNQTRTKFRPYLSMPAAVPSAQVGSVVGILLPEGVTALVCSMAIVQPPYGQYRSPFRPTRCDGAFTRKVVHG